MSTVNSRYELAAIEVNGSNVAVSTRAISYPVRSTSYLTKETDSFESIAAWSLGSPERWWEIADINTHVKYPNFIPPGTSIRIPVL